jgi:site-specific recombinase XerC
MATRRRAGFGHWHPNELRHSGASLMLAQSTPLHVVSEVLGHASIAITKDVYGHLLGGQAGGGGVDEPGSVRELN